MTGAPDPAGTTAFAGAVDWLDAVLLGPLASTVAVLAVASVGFLLLSGRVDVRRAIQVILGCFILFGASTIAGGIITAMSGRDASPELAAALPMPPGPSVPVAVAPVAATPDAFDPYAGAALPVRP